VPNPSINLFSIAVSIALILLILDILIIIYFKHQFSFSGKNLILLFLLALILRIFIILSLPFAQGHDIYSFIWAGQSIINKADIYADININAHYAFLPTIGLLFASLISLSQKFSISLIILFKLIIVSFDSLIPPLLFYIKKDFKMGLIYAFCPIPIIICAYLGQFEAITLFLFLSGLFLISLKKEIPGALVFGLSILTKPWPVAFIPLLLFRKIKNKLNFLLLILFPIIYIVLIYKILLPKTNLQNIPFVIFSYSCVKGWWGPSIIFNFLAEATRHRKILSLPSLASEFFVVLAIIYFSRLFKKTDLFRAVKFIILLIYTLSFGLGSHYLLWILPFALLTKDKYLPLYIFFTSIYLILFGVFQGLTYDFYPPKLPYIYYTVFSFSLWTFFLFWFLKEMKLNKIYPKQMLTKIFSA